MPAKQPPAPAPAPCVEIPREIMIEGVARAIERALGGPGAEAMAGGVAAKLVEHLDILTPEQAAGLLGVSTRTLERRAQAWGLDKSVALGPTNPRYFLSQIRQAMQTLVLRGARTGPALLRAA